MFERDFNDLASLFSAVSLGHTESETWGVSIFGSVRALARGPDWLSGIDHASARALAWSSRRLGETPVGVVPTMC